MDNIFIIDGQTDERLDHIHKSNVLYNRHRQKLSGEPEMFEMTVIGDGRYASHLGNDNKLIVPGEDGELLEFRIFEAGKYRQDGMLAVDVYSRATYLDLQNAKVFDPQKTDPLTSIQHVTQALAGTGWQPGDIEYAGIRTLTFDNPFNPYDYLRRIAREFELELRFYAETDGKRVTGRYVDLVDRIGEWRGRTVEFGFDLQGIRRTEKTENIVTALYGYGPEREDGTRLKVFVEDEDALQRWGRNGRHIVDIYEPQTEDANMTEERLTTLTRTELNKRINAVVEYEADIVDLENVPGMENKHIRFADTIRIKDTKFNPPLYVEARIHSQERDVFTKANKHVQLGDFIEYTQEEVQAIWKQLQEQIRQKISQAELVEYAERKVHRDTTPPENTEQLWLDTSVEPNVLKRYDGIEWVKATPTEADEVGAETPQGAQDKADQAEQNAKNYTDQTVAPINTRLTEAENAISQAEDDLAQAEQDIIAAQNTLSLITTEHEGQTALYGKVVTNELISENAVITGTFVGANAVFQNITVENAVISGTLDGVDGTFTGSLVGGEIISHASDGGMVEIRDGEIKTAVSDAYNQGAVLARDYLDIYLANMDGFVEFRSRLSYAQLYLSEQFGLYEATYSTRGLYFQGAPVLDIGRDQTGVFNGNITLNAVDGILYLGFRDTDGVYFDADPYVNGVRSRYNGSLMINDHNNGNLSISAPNGNVYLGYANTARVISSARFEAGQIYVTNIENPSEDNIFLRPTNSGGIYVRSRGTGTPYRPVYASDFVPSSSELWKDNIEEYTGSALDLINSSKIYQYEKSGSVEYGMILERETPEEVKRGEGISLYSMEGLSWKAIQELSAKVSELEQQIGGIQ